MDGGAGLLVLLFFAALFLVGVIVLELRLRRRASPPKRGFEVKLSGETSEKLKERDNDHG
jgi:hypothetical protein